MQKNRLLIWICISGGVVSLILSGYLIYKAVYSSESLKVVFCDVGQGDASLVLYKEFQLLVDAGPDALVLDCLERFMKFDKTIEFVVLTHADKDHFGGMVSVLDYYRVEHFALTDVHKDDYWYFLLKEKLAMLESSGVTKVHSFVAGDVVSYGDLKLNFVWPSRDYVRYRLLGQSEIGEVNDLSSVLHLKYKELDVLFNGDADIQVQPSMLLTGLLEKNFDIVTAPHHGSKTGFEHAWLQHVNPTVAVISVGKNNTYGHPADTILDLFTSIGAYVYRTDKLGDIVFVYENDKLIYVQ